MVGWAAIPDVTVACDTSAVMPVTFITDTEHGRFEISRRDVLGRYPREMFGVWPGTAVKFIAKTGN